MQSHNFPIIINKIPNFALQVWKKVFIDLENWLCETHALSYTKNVKVNCTVIITKGLLIRESN